MYLECDGNYLFTPFTSDSWSPYSPLFFQTSLTSLLSFYNPFPQPFYTFNVLAAELLLCCSQLLTVAEGNNSNDPLKQFLKSLPKSSGAPKQPKEDNSQPWQRKAMHESVFLFHWPQVQQKRFLVSLAAAANFRVFVTDHHLCRSADSVFAWLCSLPDLAAILKAKPMKNKPRFSFFSSVAIFKPENVTVLLWDTTKIKQWFRRK